MSTEGGKNVLPDVGGVVAGVARELAGMVRGAAFWVAALLPLSYLPLLYSVSITFAGFTKLLLVNVVAVVIGHGYGASREDEDPRDAA